MIQRADNLNNFRKEQESTDNSFFCKEGVKVCKNALLKTRLQTLIYSKGMKESEFYNKLDFTKQYWYNISWGIFPTPLSNKIKIASALGVDSRAIFKEDNK